MRVRLALLFVCLGFVGAFPLLADARSNTAAIADTEVFQGTVESVDYIHGKIMVNDFVMKIPKTMTVVSPSKRVLSRYAVKKHQTVKVVYRSDDPTQGNVVEKIIILKK